MKKTRTCLTSSAAGFLLLAMIAPCCAAEERPIAGYGEGIISFTSPTTAEANWTGAATHLGFFTRKEFLTIGESGAITGSIIFTAADGDELHVVFEGMFVSPNDAEGVYTFVGGTGRFVDASGEALFFASTPDLINATVLFVGSIRY